MSKHTPVPWKAPYLDKLPNGLYAVRIDCADPEGPDAVALLPVGLNDDPTFTALQFANARLIAKVPEMYAKLVRFADAATGFLADSSGDEMEQLDAAALLLGEIRAEARALLAEIDDV